MTPRPSDEDLLEGRTAEVRLGLVMYGGVSLAVYMNGVAQEFFNAVRGRGLYRLLKHLVDADITVDVISGTSAGGINAILLGYALANGREFASCSYMWRRFGALGQLLHGPLDGPAPSLLDTQGYFVPHVVEALASMGPIDDPSEDASPVAELDVFATGTDFAGDRRIEFDESGHPIDVMDHRAVFRLKHRADRLESSDLVASPDESGDLRRRALAKLAALTSALPVAFEPVAVAGPSFGGESSEPAGEVDWYLRRWGRLRERKYFLDGGVLVNKPFMPAIEAIADRTAEREVERHLCYVDPDPEHFKATRPDVAPGAAAAALSALTALPWYQRIATDLREVADRNSVIERYNRLADSIAARRQSAAAQPLDAWLIDNALYRSARLFAVAQSAVEGVLSRAVAADADAKRAAGDLVEALHRLTGRLDENRAAATLQSFDVFFRRRRLAHAIYELQQILFGSHRPKDVVVCEASERMLVMLNGRLQALGIVEAAIERALSEVEFHWMSVISDEPDGQAAEVWSRVRRVLTTLLQLTAEDGSADPGDYSPDALSGMNRELRRRIDAMKEAGVPAAMPPEGKSVFDVLDANEREALQVPETPDPVRRAYDEFAAIDAELFPLALASDIHERTIIGTARFSPDDVTMAFSGAPRKVQGTKLTYFGAFVNESWRANDILWGRLDAAAELILLLLNRTAYRRVYGSRTRGHGMAAASVQADRGCAAENLFPNSDPRIVERAIEALARGDWNPRAVGLLVEAAQREIIAEEMKGEIPRNDGTHPLTPDEFFAAYHVPSEGWASLLRPGTVTTVARAGVALANMGLGLWWPRRDRT